MHACPLYDETIDSSFAKFVRANMPELSIDGDPLASLLRLSYIGGAFFTLRAYWHVADKHDPVEIDIWLDRMREELQMLLRCCRSVGTPGIEDSSFGPAIAEYARRNAVATPHMVSVDYDSERPEGTRWEVRFLTRDELAAMNKGSAEFDVDRETGERVSVDYRPELLDETDPLAEMDGVDYHEGRNVFVLHPGRYEA